MPLEEGGWFLLFSLPMVLRGWGPGLGHNIHSFPASGPGPQWAARLKSATQSLGSQRGSGPGMGFHSATQPLGSQLKSSSGTWFYLATQFLWLNSSHPLVELATAHKFLSKQLPTVLNKCMAFHTAQLSNQSVEYLGQNPTGLNSFPFSRCHPAPPFLW